MTQPSEERPARLAERIRQWREDDKAGYDQAIALLCEAEAALVAASGETYRFDNADVSWQVHTSPVASGAPPQDIREPIKYGVVHFHPQKELRERFYHVVNDLRDAACIVDFWLMDIASVLKEFGYEMTITKPPAPPADVRAILEGGEK